MGKVLPGRFTADHDGEVVVFLIGMRINRLWKFWKWLPVALAMGPMMAELMAHPEKGLLGNELFVSGRTVLQVQYWRSFDDLEGFARNPDDPHLPAWRAFNQRVGTSGDVGVYHETYVVPARASETVYVNMPPFGLGKATGPVDVVGRGHAARRRLDHVADETAVDDPVPA
jgi:hypothetical protein